MKTMSQASNLDYHMLGRVKMCGMARLPGADAGDDGRAGLQPRRVRYTCRGTVVRDTLGRPDTMRSFQKLGTRFRQEFNTYA